MSTAAPVIEYADSTKETISLKAGTSLILNVNILGMPTPTAKWFIGEEEVKATVDGDGTYSRLTIKNATSKNVGKYRVVAENEVGSASVDFNVTIKGIEPQNMQADIIVPNK